MEPTLEQLINWARIAGGMALQMQQGDLQIEHKSTADLVTRADKAIEAYLLGEIHASFPTHAILGEESGDHGDSPDDQWYVDPIDGTLNYAHGIPMFTVSIAYAHQGEIKLGVVYCPPLDEMFAAEAGKGAWLNEKPMHVSTIDTLIDSMLITGFRFHLWDTPRTNKFNFERFSRECQAVRRLGSAALDICYVAAGRVEGFWEIALNAWDVAAGILIVREAGGVVGALYGEGDPLDGDILAANPVIFPLMREILLEELPRAQALAR